MQCQSQIQRRNGSGIMAVSEDSARHKERIQGEKRRCGEEGAAARGDADPGVGVAEAEAEGHHGAGPAGGTPHRSCRTPPLHPTKPSHSPPFSPSHPNPHTRVRVCTHSPPPLNGPGEVPPAAVEHHLHGHLGAGKSSGGFCLFGNAETFEQMQHK